MTMEESTETDRPIPYYCEAPDASAWDDVVPYRLSVEAGAELADVDPRGFIS
jgi:hypothetical protein